MLKSSKGVHKTVQRKAIAAGLALATSVAGISVATAQFAKAAEPSQLDAVLASSGANLDTNYPIPAGALFVSPTGSDSAAGTQAAPLATVNAAIRKASKGGTIVLREGFYREAVKSDKSITLQAFPHEKPVITGLDIVNEWTKSGNHWVTTNWTSPFSQTDFREIEIDPAYPAAGLVEQVWRNGRQLEQVVSSDQLAPGKFFIDPTTKKAIIAEDPAGATMEVANRARGLYISHLAPNSKILGLRVTSFANPHLDGGFMASFNASGTFIQHSQFDNASGGGIGTQNPDVVVDRISVINNGAEGMGVYKGHNTVIKNSQFNNNNTANFKYAGCGWACTLAGIKITHTDGLKVVNNAFVGNKSTGLWCDITCRDALWDGNALKDNAHNGMFYEISPTGTITNNYIEGSSIGLKVAGSDQLVVKNNTFVNNRYQLGAYDDDRLASDDRYTSALDPTIVWDTRDMIFEDNKLQGGPKTVRQVDSIATAQVASPQMWKSAKNNLVTGNQTFVWCQTQGRCQQVNTLAEFKTLSGLSFGTYGSVPTTTTAAPTTIAPTTTAAPTTTTTAPTTTTTTTAPPTTVKPNLQSNPGFENGQPWGVFGQARVALTKSSPLSGKQSLLVTTDSTKAMAGATSRPIAVSKTKAGKTYVGSCHVKTSSPINMLIRFQEYNQNWVRAADPVDAAPVQTKAGEWTKVSVTYTAKHNDKQLPLTVHSYEMGKGIQMQVDDCSVTEA